MGVFIVNLFKNVVRSILPCIAAIFLLSVVIKTDAKADVFSGLHFKRFKDLSVSSDKPLSKEEVNQNLNLYLTKVRLYTTTGQIEKALALVNNIKQTGSENSEYGNILFAEAEIYTYVGYWSKALEILNEAIELEPDNSVYKTRYRIIEREHGTYANVGREIESVGHKVLQQRFKGDGLYRVSDEAAFGVVAANNKLRANNLLHYDGTTSPYQGTKEKLELFYQKNFLDSGDFAKISLFATTDAPGFGASYTMLDLDGQTSLAADINKPNWEYLESFASYGTKHDLIFSRMQRIAPGLTGDISIAGNVYNLEQEQNVVNSGSVLFGMHYLIKPNSFINKFLSNNSFISINYNIDGEYIADKQVKLDGLSQKYEPLPISTNEVHSVNINLLKKYDKALNYNLFAGYAIDRFGSNGFVYGANVDYELYKDVVVNLNATRSVQNQFGSDMVEQLGGNLKLMF